MNNRSRAPLDEYARWCIGEAPHCNVAWWLIAFYLYYMRDIALVTDGYYDELCADLAARWDAIEHLHKHRRYRGGGGRDGAATAGGGDISLAAVWPVAYIGHHV